MEGNRSSEHLPAELLELLHVGAHNTEAAPAGDETPLPRYEPDVVPGQRLAQLPLHLPPHALLSVGQSSGIVNSVILYPFCSNLLST